MISERYAGPLRKAIYGDDSFKVADDPLAKDAERTIVALKAEVEYWKTKAAYYTERVKENQIEPK